MAGGRGRHHQTTQVKTLKPPCDSGGIQAVEIEDPGPPPRLQQPSDLHQPLSRIGEVAQSVGHHNAIKRRARQTSLEGIPLQ